MVFANLYSNRGTTGTCVKIFLSFIKINVDAVSLHIRMMTCICKDGRTGNSLDLLSSYALIDLLSLRFSELQLVFCSVKSNYFFAKNELFIIFRSKRVD